MRNIVLKRNGLKFLPQGNQPTVKLQLNQEFFNIPFDKISFAVLISKGSLLKRCIPAKLTSLAWRAGWCLGVRRLQPCLVGNMCSSPTD